MAIEMRQQMKLSQQLVMTPQLQQAIKLLQLSRLELQDVVRQELEENPVLDEAPELEEIREPNSWNCGKRKPLPLPRPTNSRRCRQARTPSARWTGTPISKVTTTAPVNSTTTMTRTALPMKIS